MKSTHTIVTEMYQPGSFALPEGGPELEITFEYRPPQRAVREGPLAGPAIGDSAEFLSARWTHDGSALTGDDEDWARNWLDINEDKACEKASEDLADAEDAAREFAAELRRESREPGL